MVDEPMLREYYEILNVVNEFDKRLLTVKGWGVTLSLAALAWGFQHSHYGLFLVAALSGIAFWLIEAVMKRHQMRYYLRMREIEWVRFQEAGEEATGARTTPKIDWSWSQAPYVYRGKRTSAESPELRPAPAYTYVWVLPHVLLPHAVSVLAGLILFWCGMSGTLGEMNW